MHESSFMDSPPKECLGHVPTGGFPMTARLLHAFQPSRATRQPRNARSHHHKALRDYLQTRIFRAPLWATDDFYVGLDRGNTRTYTQGATGRSHDSSRHLDAAQSRCRLRSVEAPKSVTKCKTLSESTFVDNPKSRNGLRLWNFGAISYESIHFPFDETAGRLLVISQTPSIYPLLLGKTHLFVRPDWTHLTYFLVIVGRFQANKQTGVLPESILVCWAAIYSLTLGPWTSCRPAPNPEGRDASALLSNSNACLINLCCTNFTVFPLLCGTIYCFPTLFHMV